MIINLTLNDLTEQEARDVIDGENWHSLVQQFDEYLKYQTKHIDMSEDSCNTTYAIRDYLNNMISESGLALWD